MDLVHLKAGLVLKLLLERPLPLRPGDAVEPTVLETLKALVLDRGLRLVELPEGLGVYVRQALVFRHSCH